ncbi:MAG: WS/DGAT/MGAT family O-acyltransferase, partial [Mycobacteriales bacterium]
GVIVFDPSTVPGGYTFQRVRDMLEGKLPLLPQFRRRLATVPLHLHHPVWVDDEDFDLDYHLRRIGCPAPGGPLELSAVVGDIAGRQLDRTKPLWEMWVVEGLADGHVAVVAKMHHATIDGVSGANLMVHLFDLEPDPPRPAPEAAWVPERRPGELDLIRYAVTSRLTQPFGVLRVIPATVQAAGKFVRVRRRTERGAGMPAPFTAPRTSFNQTITPHRKVAWVDVPLADIKAVKHAFGTTVNDVVLAVCAGALRRYLLGRGELPEKALSAVVPISVRTEGGGKAGANRISAMFTSLATDLDDPVARLRLIHETNKNAKEEHHAVGAEMLQDWAEFAAPTTFSLAARLYSNVHFADLHPVIYNLIISNVPGPPIPLYFAGAELVALYPLGPIFDGIGLNITVLSHRDAMGFGFIACREQMPDLWDLAAAVREATAELVKCVDQPAAKSPGARRRK